MAVQIGAKPDSGFDDPIGMLTDCHRRIEHFLEILCVVADRARGRSLTEEEASAVASALHYFRVGGQRHTADEEQSLFPRLREDAGAGKPNQIDGLESDHQEANQLHADVDRLFSEWMASSRLDGLDESSLHAKTQRLNNLYQEHIQLEEKIVFPLAARLLDEKALSAMGQEFRARRT